MMPVARYLCIFINVGLGEAAKRNVGTGANQIPDMGSFMLSASVPGYQKLPSGLIIQWGPIDVPLTSQDTVTYFPIAFPNRCLRVFATQDYTPGSANVGYIACAGYNQDPVKFISRAGVPGAYFHERRSLNNFHRDRVITFEQIAE
ncbi:gp53-like domain-containing protein [Escherichia coli]